MKYLSIIFLFALASCETLAQRVSEGKAMSSKWFGYYDPEISTLSEFDSFRDYIKIDVQGLYHKKIGFNITLVDGKCIGEPKPQDGNFYHLTDIILETDTEFQAYFVNALEASDKNTYLFAIERSINGTTTNINLLMPRKIESSDSVQSILANTSLRTLYTFSDKKLPEETIARDQVNPDADSRPFLEKMTYPNKNFGFWEIAPAVKIVGGGLIGSLLPLIKMDVGSRAVVFNEPVKTNGVILLFKDPNNTDSSTPKEGLPVYGFAYTKNDPINKPSYPLHYTPRNFKHGIYYFQGNIDPFIKKKNAYLPLMVIGNNLIGGWVKFGGDKVSEKDWSFFTDYPMQDLMTSNIMLTRVKEESLSRQQKSLGFDPNTNITAEELAFLFLERQKALLKEQE